LLPEGFALDYARPMCHQNMTEHEMELSGMYVAFRYSRK